MKDEEEEGTRSISSTSHEYSIEHIQVLQSVVILFTEKEEDIESRIHLFSILEEK